MRTNKKQKIQKQLVFFSEKNSCALISVKIKRNTFQTKIDTTCTQSEHAVQQICGKIILKLIGVKVRTTQIFILKSEKNH